MFKVTIEGRELKEIIEKALCNMNKKASISLFKKIVLSDNEGYLTAYTSDAEYFLQVKTKEYTSEGSTSSIGIDEEDLKVLLKITGIVTIIETEDAILIKNGKKNISLMKHDISDFPILPEGEYTNSLMFKESDFTELINNLAIFTSDNDNNKIMQYINFNLADSRIEALDGCRIGMKTIQAVEKLVNDGNILVNNNITTGLKKTLNKKSDAKIIISQSDECIRVSGESFIYIQRKYDGKYFNISGMLTDEYDLSFKAETNEMLSHVKYYSDNVIAKSDKKPVVFKITNDTLISYARNSRFEVSDSLEIKDHQGKDLTIAFNPYFWLDALKVIDSDVFTVEGINSKAPFFISANTYSFIILPVNIREEEELMEKYLSKLAA